MGTCMHPLPHSLPHSLINSLPHSLTHSLPHSLPHSLTMESSSPSPKRSARSQRDCVHDSTSIGSLYEKRCDWQEDRRREVGGKEREGGHGAGEERKRGTTKDTRKHKESSRNRRKQHKICLLVSRNQAGMEHDDSNISLSTR